MKLLIEEKPEVQAKIIRIEGRLDSYTNQIFEEALENLFSDGFHRLILDLSKLDYINSTGLGAIAAAHQRTILNSGYLSIFGIHNKVAMIFRITRVGSQLNIFRNEEEAVHAAKP